MQFFHKPAIFLTCAAFAVAFPAPAAEPRPSAPLAAGVTAVFRPERSGRNHRTWDLGPDANDPARRDYLVEIGASLPDDATVRLPAALGGEPLTITLADGRRIEWRIAAGGLPLTLEDSAAPSGEPDGAPLRPATRPGDARREGGGFSLALPPRPMTTRLTLAEGLRLERPERGGSLPRLRFIDERGDIAYQIELGGASATADGERGEIALTLAPADPTPDVVTALGTSAAGFGGYQCNRGDGSGTGGNDNTGLYNRYVYVGEYTNTTYPRYTCDGYLRFDIAGAALPETARAYQAQLSPLLLRSNNTPAVSKTLHFVDVDNNRALPFLPTGTYFDATLGVWNDFNTMSGGRADYGSVTFTGTTNLSPNLNAAAVADLNGRVRSLGYFAIGIYADAVAQGNYAIFQANDGAGSSSNLAIYYTDYAPKGVTLTRYYWNYSTNTQIAIHNYGEAVSLNGWRTRFVDAFGNPYSYTFPNVTLANGQSLAVIAAVGVNTPTTLYTGSNSSFSGITASPGQFSLCKGDCALAGNGVDFLCVGANPAAPPSGAGWDGACLPGWGSPGTAKLRVDDEDTDTASDFTEVSYGSSPALPTLPANLKGTRRRSDVVFNKALVYSNYDWFEIANYGRAFNLVGWTIDLYSRGGFSGTYAFDANSVMNPGEIMWLSEPTGLVFTPGRLRKNTGVDTLWSGSAAIPAGGGLVLRDKGGRVRDTLLFGGMGGAFTLSADAYWMGPPVKVGATDYWELRKTADGFAPSAANWTNLSYTGSGGWGSWSPGQTGMTFRQDEIATGQSDGAASIGYYSYGSGGAFGAGNVLTVTRQVGLEEAIFQAAPLALPAPATFVIKKQGAGSLYYTRSLPDVTAWGHSLVSTGKITPPVVLDPGTYAIMLYVNRNWYDAEIYNPNQKLSFGAFSGVTYEASYTPAAAFSTNYPGWGMHAGLGTIDPPFITSAAALPAGARNVAYPAFAHAATGGYGAYTWSITAGVLPAGLTLSSGGALSGTPTVEGYFTFTARVTDAAGLWSEQAETLFVYPPLEVGTSFVTDYTTASEPYAYALAAYGGVPPYSWICSGLPAGLSCNAAGNLTGTLNGAVGDGVYGFSVQVTDALGVTASRSLSITVYRAPQIITLALPDGAVGRLYGAMVLQAAGGQGTVTWSVSVGALPPGLSLNGSTGTITGTPTTRGAYGLTILYSTSLGGSAARAYTINITDDSGPAHWIRKGLAGGSVTPIYSPNFATDRTIMGTNNGTLYVSRDAGYYWKPLGFSARKVTANNSTWDNDVNTIAFSPDFNATAPASGSNKTLFVATAHSGVWYSDNFGTSWSQLNTGLASADDPSLYYAADFFAAPDYPSSHRVYCRTFVGGADYYALHSGVIDTGAKTISWNRISPSWLRIGDLGFNSGLSLFWSPTFATDTTVFAKISSSGYHIYRSVDAGVNWVKVHDVAAGKSILWLEISPRYSTDGTLFYSDGIFNGVVHRSTDGGRSFVSLARAWPILKLSFPPDYNAGTNPVIFATTYNLAAGTIDLLRSTDNGRIWTLRNTLGYTLLFPSFSPNFGPGPGNDQLIIGAFFNGGTLTRSEDGGVSATPSDGGLFIQEIQSVAFAPDFAASRKVFLAIGGNIYYSGNGGKAWKKAVTPGDRSIQSLRVSPAFASDQKVYAYACTQSDDCVLWRSIDGGLNFSALGPSMYQLQDVEDFQLSPNFGGDQMIFLTTYPLGGADSKFQRSSNGGTSFVAQGAQYYDTVDNFGISPGFASDQTLYANDWTGVGPNFADTRLSINGANPDVSGGLSWSDFATGPDAPKGIPPAFPPQYNRISGVSGTASHTFFWNCRKTTNGGATWTPSPASGAGCGGGWAGKVYVSPTYATDNTLYSLVQEADANNPAPGLFRSTDGGGAFAAMSAAGYPAAFDYLNQVAISPNYATDGLVLAATAAGLYKTTDFGATWQLTTGSDPISPDVSAVASDPNLAGGIYLGTQSGEVFASADGGITATNIKGSLSCAPVNSLYAANAGAPVTALIAACPTGLYRTTLTGGSWSGVWSAALVSGNFLRLSDGVITGTTHIYAANTGGVSWESVNAGASWSGLGSGGTNASSISYSGLTGPTIVAPAVAGKPSGPAPRLPAGNTASLWSAVPASGARYSLDNGTNWLSAPGGGDYTLPAAPGWTVIQPLGVNAATIAREVLIGHNAQGLFHSTDGGVNWRNVSGPGSGLESTSRNVGAVLKTTNVNNTTDVLVGMIGSTTGGVYLSGDGGGHWTQINQGFDPNSLNISTLAKTSCSGCPVQYYSGTYGSGVYTRTIPVNNPPAITSWCFTGTGCACGTAAAGGPIGQPFRLCGANFLALPVVEFDGVPATGCTMVSSTVITCTGTPVHWTGASVVRVRNTDTRTGYMPQNFTFTGGGARANNLTVVKSGINAVLNYTCAGCTSPMPQVYRSQNAPFSLNVEKYTGGAGTYTNTGVLAAGSNNTYFWSVE